MIKITKMHTCSGSSRFRSIEAAVGGVVDLIPMFKMYDINQWLQTIADTAYGTAILTINGDNERKISDGDRLEVELEGHNIVLRYIFTKNMFLAVPSYINHNNNDPEGGIDMTNNNINNSKLNFPDDYVNARKMNAYLKINRIIEKAADDLLTDELMENIYTTLIGVAREADSKTASLIPKQDLDRYLFPLKRLTAAATDGDELKYLLMSMLRAMLMGYMNDMYEETKIDFDKLKREAGINDNH